MANKEKFTVSISKIVGEKKYADLKDVVINGIHAKVFKKRAKKLAAKEVEAKIKARKAKKLEAEKIKAAIRAQIDAKIATVREKAKAVADAKASVTAEAEALNALLELKIDKELLGRNSAESGVNEASRDVIHAKMQEKETLTITKVSIVSRYASFGKAVDLLTKEEKLLYKNKYILVLP